MTSMSLLKVLNDSKLSQEFCLRLQYANVQPY